MIDCFIFTRKTSTKFWGMSRMRTLWGIWAQLKSWGVLKLPMQAVKLQGGKKLLNLYKALYTPILPEREPDPNVENGAFVVVIADGTEGNEFISLYITFFEPEER